MTALQRLCRLLANEMPGGIGKYRAPQTKHELKAELLRLINLIASRLKAERILIVVDAVDLMVGAKDTTSWIPSSLPATFRLVFSSATGALVVPSASFQRMVWCLYSW